MGMGRNTLSLQPSIVLPRRYQVPSVLINLNWYYAIQPYIKDKAHGGPFEYPFVHADEAETSYSLALFPEMITWRTQWIPISTVSCRPGMWTRQPTHTNAPIPWYGHTGLGTIEIIGNPEGV